MRILIVEDEPLTAMFAADALSDVGHEIVGSAVSMAEAIDIAEREAPQLVITDIDLIGPGSGAMLARIISERWGMPCLFASGEPAAAASLQAHAMGIIRKPYSADTLQRSVRTIEAMIAGGLAPVPPRGLELFSAA